MSTEKIIESEGLSEYMKLAVKYCGGCAPEYDRTELFEAIKRAAGDRIEWAAAQDEVDAVLFVSGCQRACADKDFTLNIARLSISDAREEVEEIIKKLFGLSDRRFLKTPRQTTSRKPVRRAKRPARSAHPRRI